jgi:iron complex outermembrane recepter protein
MPTNDVTDLTARTTQEEQKPMGKFAMSRRARFSSVVAFSLAALSSQVFAADGPSPATQPADTSTSEPQLQEVMVTATRRSERQQDVPISIAALSGEQLDTLGLQSMDDISRVTPGVTFQRNGTSPTGNYDDQDSDINIRGVQSTAGAATTAIYIDDTPIESRRIGYGTQNAYPVVFDLDRVEILRGPQGTLFGASSEGGTVRFIEPQPSLSGASAYTKAEVGTSYDGAPTLELGAAGGAPIIDNVLGFRISASVRHEGGWVDRVDPTTLDPVDADANSRDLMSVRAALTWKPIEGLTITPSYYHQQIRSNDTAAYWPQLSDPPGSYVNGNRGPVSAFDPFSIAAVHIDWRLSGVDLISNTAFYDRNQHTTSDYTQLLNEIYFGASLPPPGVYSPAYLTDEQRNWYEEIRLQSADDAARVTWTTGLFFTNSKENSAELIYDPTINARSGFTICAAFACPNGLQYNEPYDYVIDKQVAVFGEAVLKLTDTLKLTAGVRVSHDIIAGASYVSGPFLGQAPLVSDSSTTETPVTPRAVLSWQPDHDDMFYGSASKGFRPGGVNAGIGAACDSGLAQLGLTEAPPAYKSDSLWSYEIGSKNTIWDRRVQINTSLFFIDWKDIQQSVYLGSCGLSYVGNLGQVHSKGGDFQMLARATDSLNLTLTASYVDAAYISTECATPAVVCTGPGAVAAPVVSDGNVVPAAPWTVVAGLDYTFPKFMNRDPYLHVLYTFSSAQKGLVPYQDPANALSDPTIAGFAESKDLSMRGGLRWGGMDVSLYVNNVFNQHPVLFNARDFASPAVTQYFDRSVQPLNYGLTWTYHY